MSNDPDLPARTWTDWDHRKKVKTFVRLADMTTGGLWTARGLAQRRQREAMKQVKHWGLLVVAIDEELNRER